MPYYLIRTPDVTLSFIGTKKDSALKGYVSMCGPDGVELFTVPSKWVTDSSEEKMAAMLAEDAKRKWN